ncbi:hypothetical protein D3C80_2163890 [compost metagenome]
MDRPELSAIHAGECGADCLPDVRLAGVSGAGRLVRKLDAAAGGDPDCAYDHALGAVWRVADWR